MKIQRKVFCACLGAVGCLALWATAVSCLGFYYFWPSTTLDSEHVGVLVVRGKKAAAISVGTTRAAAPGTFLGTGSATSNSVFSFYAVGDHTGQVASQYHIRRWPFWISWHDTATDMLSFSGVGWPCIWPSHFLRASEIWRHNKALLSDVEYRARER